MDTNQIISLVIGGSGASAVISAIVTSYLNKRKNTAEADSVVVASSTILLERYERQAKHMEERINALEVEVLQLRMDLREEKKKREEVEDELHSYKRANDNTGATNA
jgi:predicted RNase H-like nuclease (RuvC/YqgF family)